MAPDGFLAAVYGVSNSFEVHDLEARRLLQALPWEARPDLTSPPVAFAHDGFAIISGGRGSVCIWDTEQGDKLQVLQHSGELTARVLTLCYF